ncbi:methionine ABC transporter ATP-binding protein [Candidatus Marinamargulisbacteria bacterium SCGC AG-439-L15]|nr:methionine ABC transporter ATP-binding protein [Candidatus Marinamargulisbacteria bacterium SCGC AG-439-L15]
MALITVENISFHYSKDQAFSLNVQEFSVQKNRNLFLEGPSGSGKTTFLNLITGLIKPNSGLIRIMQTEISHLTTVQCDRFRADHFGIIFQLFNLIPYLSVLENVLLPCSFSKLKREKALSQSTSLESEARRLCEELDINDDLLKKPVYQLSIGQQQRVAIARAMIGQPEIIIADEPTSALDNERKEQFLALLLKECEKYQATLIFVSHDTELKSAFDDVCHLKTLTSPLEVTNGIG